MGKSRTSAVQITILQVIEILKYFFTLFQWHVRKLAELNACMAR